MKKNSKNYIKYLYFKIHKNVTKVLKIIWQNYDKKAPKMIENFRKINLTKNP